MKKSYLDEEKRKTEHTRKIHNMLKSSRMRKTIIKIIRPLISQ